MERSSKPVICLTCPSKYMLLHWRGDKPPSKKEICHIHDENEHKCMCGPPMGYVRSLPSSLQGPTSTAASSSVFTPLTPTSDPTSDLPTDLQLIGKADPQYRTRDTIPNLYLRVRQGRVEFIREAAYNQLEELNRRQPVSLKSFIVDHEETPKRVSKKVAAVPRKETPKQHLFTVAAVPRSFDGMIAASGESNVAKYILYLDALVREERGRSRSRTR